MDFGAFTNLGTAGVAVLVMWWMYQSSAAERTRHDARIDKRDEVMRELESDIRNKFAAQLMENTNAMLAHSKIMKRVIDIISKYKS